MESSDKRSTFILNRFIGSSNSYQHKDINLRLPLVIGDFSLDHVRNILFDNSNKKDILMNYLSPHNRKVQFDLNKGLDKVKRKDFQRTKEEGLDRLLKWILENKYKFETKENPNNSIGLRSLSTNFICFRGLLTELLSTPYEQREGWIIHATKFRGTIYLLAKDTPEKEKRRNNETDIDRKMSSWGYKFEQYMTCDDTSEAVNENEEYCCVLRSRLLSHSLVYGAEVDCVDKSLYHDPHSNLKAFIELKTCKELSSQRDLNNFYKFRLRKWFLQSHLAGIPHLICGFRNPNGIVQQLKSYSIEEMPAMAKIYWNKNTMFAFLDHFLSWLKAVIVEDHPNFIYEIVRPPGSKEIFYSSLGIKPELMVLTKEYTDNIF